MNKVNILTIAGLVSCLSCTQKPPTSMEKKQFSLIKLGDMHKIDVGSGETVYQAEGRNNNIKSMSFVITETKKGGGPPLHIHPVEEAHVVMSGTVTYFIADSVFTVTAPYIINIPANTPHTFINSGDTVLHLIGVFGQDNFGPYKPIGKNPLQKEQ